MIRTFSLMFEDDGVGQPKRVDFEGVDPAAAFDVMSREHCRRRAKLYEGKKLLSTLRRTGVDGWEIGS